MDVVEMAIVVDALGYLQARAECPHEALGGFLSSDVQASLSMCRRVREWLEHAPHAGGSFDGNSCAVTVDGGIVRIESRYAAVDEASRICRLPLADFEEALGLWEAAIRAELRRVNG
ncbi:MAG: hypothetical protein R3A79_30035 [Nannocystaceae bacterium]